MVLQNSEKDFSYLLSKLNFNTDKDKTLQEFKLLQVSVMQAQSSIGEIMRIDTFWHKTFESLNSDNYSNVSKVIKCLLCLSHGSADIERSFSRSKRILTEDKCSMGERMLKAKLNIVSDLASVNFRPELMYIDKDLMQAARRAYSSYTEYLEDKKKKVVEETRLKEEQENKIRKEKELQKEFSETKEAIQSLEEHIKSQKVELEETVALKERTITDAQKMIGEGAKKKDLHLISVGQGMLDNAFTFNTKLGEINNNIKTFEKQLNVKRSKALDYASQKLKTN